jgi:hypothetical protein
MHIQIIFSPKKVKQVESPTVVLGLSRSILIRNKNKKRPCRAACSPGRDGYEKETPNPEETS